MPDPARSERRFVDIAPDRQKQFAAALDESDPIYYVGRTNPECSHWPGQTRCLVCGMGVKPGESRYG